MFNEKECSGTPKYYAKVLEKISNGKGYWNYLKIGVFDESNSQIGEYTRNYSSFYKTFYPFELNGKWYALYSKHYTATRVMSLPDCQDICGEDPEGSGFCPTHYYVPDIDEKNLKYFVNPKHVEEEMEVTWADGTKEKISGEKIENPRWPIGSFGFIAGCVWGDDSSWKIQFLDLRNIPTSFIRDDRFGYIEMPGHVKTLKECINFDWWNDEYPYVHITCENYFPLCKKKKTEEIKPVKKTWFQKLLGRK